MERACLQTGSGRPGHFQKSRITVGESGQGVYMVAKSQPTRKEINRKVLLLQSGMEPGSRRRAAAADFMNWMAGSRISPPARGFAASETARKAIKIPG